MVDLQHTTDTVRVAVALIFILYVLPSIDAQNAKSECPIGFQLATSKNKEKVCYFLMEGPFAKKFDGCAGNIFTTQLYYSLDLPKSDLMLWTDFKSSYPEGPFVDWSYTSSMGELLNVTYAVFRDPKLNISDELCVAIHPLKNFTAVKCDEKHYRYCFVNPYSNKELSDGCDELTDGIRFWSPQPMCLVRQEQMVPGVFWKICKSKCNSSGGSLLGRGWRYANYFERSGTISKYPLNIVFKRSDHTFLTYEYDKSEIPSKDWHFGSSNMKPGKLLGAIQNNSWSLVGDDDVFNNVICERPVELRNVSLILSHIGDDLILTLSDTSLSESNIKCYTDSVSYYHHLVVVTRSPKSVLTLKTTWDGYYWCTHTDSRNFHISESNRELFIKELSSVHNLYAVKIQTTELYSLNKKILREKNEKWTELLKDFISRTYKVCTSADITAVKIKKLYLDAKTVLLHVKLCPKIKSVKSEVTVWIDIVILYMKPVYYCDKDKNLSLGNKYYSSNCTIYTCNGNYVDGVGTVPTPQDDCELHSGVHSSTAPKDVDVTTTVSTTTIPKDPTHLLKNQQQQQQLKQLVKDLELMFTNYDEPENIQAKFEQVSKLIHNKNGEMEIPGSLLRQIEYLGTKIDTISGLGEISTDNIALLGATATLDEPILGLQIADKEDLDGSKYSLNNKDIDILEDKEDIKPGSYEMLVLLPKSMVTSNRHVSFVVYGKDSVFKKRDINGTYAISVVVNVNIENVTKFPADEVLEIQFGPINDSDHHSLNRTCAYWHYTDDDSGFWSQQGCNYVPAAGNSSLDTCKCNHLTHFAQIVVFSKFAPKDKATLEQLTIVGCWMSIIGLLIVGLTALHFRSWRSKYTNKVWLQLCVSIFLLCVSFLVFVYARFNEHDFFCRLTGVVLHYSVLASFCWMLVVAILSYKELVLVFHGDTSHKLLKAAAFGWGAPCTVVGLLVSITPQSYVGLNEDRSPTEGAFCFPSGIAQWLGVYAPIALMLLVNWTLFALILRSVYVSRVESPAKHRKDSNEALRCATVSCLLAFLFGLPWSFGMFAFTEFMAYLFTILANFQGFVLFIFIVIGNKKTRDLWLIKMKLKQQRLFSSAAYTNRSVTDVPWRPDPK